MIPMKPTPTLRVHLVSVFTLLLLALCPRLYAYDLTVDRSQPASATNFLTVQAAINAAPTGLTAPFTIFIKNGKYKEVITVASNKPFIQLVGESVANTILTYNNSAGTVATATNNAGGTVATGTALGTQGSASVTVGAADFSAVNITFENAFGEAASNGQAVAILVNADRAAFRNCRFLGNQDTMYLKGNGTPRQYFVDCYIEGNTDFIFGSSIALFERCNVYAKVKATATTSFILAPNTTNGQAYGFVLKNCNITGNPVTNGTNTKYDLARPWQNTPRATFLNCNMATPLILDEGWAPTSSAGSATLAQSYFQEYQSTHFNGNPIKISSRVLSGTAPLQPPTAPAAQPAQTSTQLTASEAATYTTANILAGWNPCAVIDCATPFVKSAVVNNFKGTKGTPSTFTWNTSFPISGDVLSIFRAQATPPAALGAFTINGSTTEPNDTTYNYTYSDAAPASGSLYKYYIQASATPRQTTSDTVTISAAPTIAVTGTFSAFAQLVGSPSSAQTVSVAGTDLQGNILVTAPANYQVSNAVAGTYASTLTLPATAGAVTSTAIYVRLNAAGVGTYNGTLALTSTNATTVNLALTGSAIVAVPVTTAALQWWPLRISAADSAGARNARLLNTTPTLRHYYVSNGTTVPTIPAYSSKFGQALGSNNVAGGALPSPGPGDGVWSANAPYNGTGGNIKRGYYEQFTVSAAAGSTVRVDAVTLQAAFYNTSSGTTMGMTYSKTGFTTADSTEITSAMLNGATAAYVTAGSATNNLTRVVALANNTGGPSATTNLFRLVLADPSGPNPTGGVTLAGGQTLTFRLYFTCSSGSLGRYAMLRNLRVEGDAQATTVGDISLSNGTLTGTYNNVTITAGAVGDQVSIMLPLTVNNALTTASGAVLNPIQPIAGAGNVSIGAGSELRIADANGISSTGTSTTSGPIRNTGVRSFSTDATYAYNGTATQVTGTGLPATVRGLTVNNTAAVPANQLLTLTNAVAVRQLVRLQSGTLTTGTPNNLTLLSTPGFSAGANAGQTALIDNTGGVVTGAANVMQRAIDNVYNGDNIGYHHFSSPMTGTTLGDLSDPGFAPVFNDATGSPAFNATAAVGYVRPFPTVLGYDQSRVGSPTLAVDQTPFNQGYFAGLSAGTTWVPGKAYAVNSPNAVTLDFTGQFNNAPTATTFAGLTGLARNGNADGGWQLVGNPFPAPLNFATVNFATQATNLDASIYQYHSTSRYGGYFTTYQGVSGLGSQSQVPAGGGFFVRVTTPNSSNGALSLSNANRVTAYTAGAQASFGRAAATTRPVLTLTATAANGLSDALTVYAQAGATAGLDPRFDAAKLTNPHGLNLAARAGTDLLAIDGRPAFTAATVVPLSLGVPAAGTYALAVTELANFGSTRVYLRDAATGTDQLLSAGTQVRLTLASATAGATRYALVFRPADALATAPNALAAQATVYPNPAHDRFTLTLPPVAGAASATATLLNALGQVVNTRTVALPAAGATAEYATAGLAPGIYTLRLQAGGETTALRVAVN